jgi:dTDP-4-amino-4,6-dideoxygalactose transaminase
VLSLPMYPELADADVDRVAAALLEAVEEVA